VEAPPNAQNKESPARKKETLLMLRTVLSINKVSFLARNHNDEHQTQATHATPNAK